MIERTKFYIYTSLGTRRCPDYSLFPGRFYREIFDIKVDPLNLKSQNQAKNIPVVLPSSPIKI